MNSEGQNSQDIVQRYVSICNVALFKNAKRFPFKQILEAAEKTSYGRMIEVEVYDLPSSDKYVFSLAKGRIMAEKHDCGDSCKCDGKWSVSKDYLDNVIREAPLYIENPARIDWDWLYLK